MQLGAGSDSLSPNSPSHSPHPWGAAGVPLPETEGECWTPLVSAPFPTVITLRSDSGDDHGNTDIWCGKCGQPVGYCHCNALPVLLHTPQHAPQLAVPGPSGQPAADDISIITPVPGQGTDRKPTIMGYVVHDLTQDSTNSEEGKTLISTSGGVDKDNHEGTDDMVIAVVPDGVRGGGSCLAYNCGNRGASRGRGGPTTHTRRVDRDNSPTPAGYICNRGLAFVPIHILADGRRTLAKYIRIIMSGNPKVFTCMECGLPIYCAKVHAAAMHDMGCAPEYTHDQLQYLRSDYCGRQQVDDAIA